MIESSRGAVAFLRTTSIIEGTWKVLPSRMRLAREVVDNEDLQRGDAAGLVDALEQILRDHPDERLRK
jgi:hypothetical protein